MKNINNLKKYKENFINSESESKSNIIITIPAQVIPPQLNQETNIGTLTGRYIGIPVPILASTTINGVKVYVAFDSPYTKMVDFKGNAKYYKDSLTQFDPSQWSNYPNINGNYILNLTNGNIGTLSGGDFGNRSVPITGIANVNGTTVYLTTDAGFVKMVDANNIAKFYSITNNSAPFSSFDPSKWSSYNTGDYTLNLNQVGTAPPSVVLANAVVAESSLRAQQEAIKTIAPALTPTLNIGQSPVAKIVGQETSILYAPVFSELYSPLFVKGERKINPIGEQITISPINILKNVNANLTLWLDANDPLGNNSTVQPNTPVNKWVDKSGSGRNAIAEIYSNLNAAALSQKNNTNNNSILRFDENLNYKVTYPNFPNISYTIITVQKMNTSKPFSRLIHAPNDDDNGIFVGTVGNSVATFTGSENIWNDVTANSQLISNLNTWRIVSMVVNNNTLLPFVDGIPQSTKVGTTKKFSDINIGFFDDQSWIGDVGDILIYDNALTKNDRVNIEIFLSKKWGINYNLITQEETSNNIKILPAGILPEGISEKVYSEKIYIPDEKIYIPSEITFSQEKIYIPSENIVEVTSGQEEYIQKGETVSAEEYIPEEETVS